MKATIALLAIGLSTSLFLDDQILAAPLTVAAVTRQPIYINTTNSSVTNSIMTQDQINTREGLLAHNPLWSVPLSKLSETQQRPLFTPSRRPPAPVETPAQSAPPPQKSTASDEPQLALVGTVVNNGEGFGLFINPTTNALIRLKTGDEYQGWVLRSVTNREAVLEKSHLTTTLSLPTPRS